MRRFAKPAWVLPLQSFQSLEAGINALRLDDEARDDRFDSVLARCTVGIACAVGLPDEKIKGMANGASIYHVGQVPALCSILLQPDDLLPEELALMCKLCDAIHEILRPIAFLADGSELVYAYRERFDGTGYPRGLKGDEIQLEARIFSVALFVTAITSWGRSRLPLSSGHAELQQRSAQRFDPEVVKVVLSMSDTTWEDMRTRVLAL